MRKGGIERISRLLDIVVGSMTQKVLEVLGELSRRQPSQVFELPLLVRWVGKARQCR